MAARLHPRLMLLTVPLLVAGCASEAGPPRWRCWFDADPPVCRCYFATEEDISSAGYSPADFDRAECPVADYLCCERGRAPERIDTDACACANPRSTIYCRGDYPIVPSCP